MRVNNPNSFGPNTLINGKRNMSKSHFQSKSKKEKRKTIRFYPVKKKKKSKLEKIKSVFLLPMYLRFRFSPANGLIGNRISLSVFSFFGFRLKMGFHT